MVRIQSVIERKGVLLSAFFLIVITLLSNLAIAQTSTVCPIAAYEGQVVRLNPEAFDPDPEIGPAGQLLWEFGPPFNSEGIWQTIKGLRGIFNFWVSVSDGELKDTVKTCVEVLPDNRDPILEPVPEVRITRGENTRIDATCYDPDGDAVEISYRFNGKDVAYILYEPPGTYDLDITCTDGFGGIDTYRTKLHIGMPLPAPEPARPAPAPVPAPVTVAEPEDVGIVELHTPAPAPVDPCDVEFVTPEVGDIELRTPAPEPAPATIDECEVQVQVSEPVKPEIIEVHYPRECPPCPEAAPAPVGDIDVVVYGSLQDVDTSSLTSVSFEIQEPEPAPAPEPEAVIAEPEELPCHPDIERKQAVTRSMCC